MKETTTGEAWGNRVLEWFKRVHFILQLKNAEILQNSFNVPSQRKILHEPISTKIHGIVLHIVRNIIAYEKFKRSHYPCTQT